MKQIYNTLKILRKKNGLTQLYIADILGLSESAYSKIETGITDISLSKLELISDLYKMSVAELLHYPYAVQVVGEQLKPEITISLKVVSPNHIETVKEVLKKIDGIKLND